MNSKHFRKSYTQYIVTLSLEEWSLNPNPNAAEMAKEELEAHLVHWDYEWHNQGTQYIATVRVPD